MNGSMQAKKLCFVNTERYNHDTIQYDTIILGLLYVQKVTSS